MWEPFTERARQSIVLAQVAAQSLGHTSIGTEHILLGILEEGQSLGARALQEHGLTTPNVRKEIELMVGVENAPRPMQEFVFNPMAKRTIEIAFDEARQLNHNYIGTEHILLGLMRQEDGVAARVILKLADKPQTIRDTILEKIGRETRDDGKSTPRQEKRDDFRSIARCPHCHRPVAITLSQAGEKR